MSGLDARVDQYLRLRRALGFKLTEAGHLLPQFVAFLDAVGAEAITVELAVVWARQSQDVQAIQWAHRLGAVRGFARWLATIDPVTEIPPTGVFAARQQRPAPYIYTTAEIAHLVQAAHDLLRPPLLAATYETLFGLLGCSGMRIGEAVGLACADVDLAEGIVTIRHPKLDRERLVPLHPSTTEALRRYVGRRDRPRSAPGCDAFFVSAAGRCLTRAGVHYRFQRLTTTIGLRTTTNRPRIQDLRHSVAVRTLIDFYRADADEGDDEVTVTTRLPLLSTLLGHVNPDSTYWYLTAVPELMQLAAARLERRLREQP